MPQETVNGLTFEDLLKATGAKEPSVRKALAALGIYGEREIADRRNIRYPHDAPQRIVDWLKQQQ